MAKFERTPSGRGIIAEGIAILKIVNVTDSHDDPKKVDFPRKIDIEMKDKSGKTVYKSFNLEKHNNLTNQIENNEKICGFFNSFIDGAIGDDSFNDTKDLEGCFIEVEIKHEKYTNKDGEEKTRADFVPWLVTKRDGFSGHAPVSAAETVEDELDDLDDMDDFLNE